MKTLRFAALSLMLLLSAGAFAQISFHDDTIKIYNREVSVDTIKNCENYNHLVVSGSRPVECSNIGFKTITVNGGTFVNRHSYNTTNEHVRIFVNAITINTNGTTVHYKGDFKNYGNIYSGEITLNGGDFSNYSGINNVSADIFIYSGWFSNGTGTIDGEITLNGGTFTNDASIEYANITLTGGTFVNRQDIDSRSNIVVEGGIFENWKKNEYNDGGLPASITVEGGQFYNGINENGADLMVTGEITVKSGEFHNWGKIIPSTPYNRITLKGGEFVNETSGKITLYNSVFIDGGTFTNTGSITSLGNNSISIFGGEFVSNTNLTGLPFLLNGGKLTNNNTITLNPMDSIPTSITVYAAGAITNNGIIDGKGMVISHGGECINTEGASIKHAYMGYDEFQQGDKAFINYGTIDSLSVSYGTFTNNGNVRKVFVSENDSGSGTFTNEANGTITDSIALSNRGVFTNKGTINLNKIIEVAGSTFINYGTLSSFVDCKTGGTFIWGEGASSDSIICFNDTSTFILKSGIVLDYHDPYILRFSDSAKVVIEEGAELKNYFRELILRKRIETGRWNFMGLGMNTDLRAFSGVATEDNAMYALAYNYTTNNWDNNYLYINTASIPRGEGILVYAEKETVVDFADSLRLRTDSVITVSKENTVTQRTDEGNWLAMANPYASPIAVSTITSQLPQGKCVYLYDGTTWTTIGNGDDTTRKINQYEGFFVNISADSTKQIVLPNPNFKGFNPAEEEERDEGDTTTSGFDDIRSFLTVSVSTDGYKVPVSFAQNDAAMAGYDIFDANKLFGNGTVAEPYLVCNGVNLCKEEVNEASYAATMNIRSSEARSVEIAADNVPEGYSLVLKDGETETPMNQGDIYTTDIASGENAERFKLLINKNNVSLDEIAATEKPKVSSINRNIIIEGGEMVRTEVFNTLGQKVYETTKRNFTLNDLEAGAYVLRVQSTSGMQSSKIVIR